MNKSELLPQICKILDSFLLEEGYRYLKGQEKYQKKEQGIKLWFYPNITYWPTSNYCMMSPRVSVHVDKLEDFNALHSKLKVDRHSPTLTLLSDNLESAKFWSISNGNELQELSDEIIEISKRVLLPKLVSWSTPKKVAIEAIQNKEGLFHSELHRLTKLFAYFGAYNDPEILREIVESVDLESIARSRMQLDSYYLGILRSMEFDIPAIGKIGINL